MLKPLYVRALGFIALLTALSACISRPNVRDSLLDASTVPDLSEAEEVRVGDIRYGKQRLEEREAVAWSFLKDGSFQRGTPRGDEKRSVRAKVYEVGQAEKGKYRGFTLERWDVIEETEGEPARQYHHYFFRSPSRLIHLPKMAKGEARPLWEKGQNGAEVSEYLGARWNVKISEDRAHEVPELAWHRNISVPGEGSFKASPSGEALSQVEEKNGSATALTVLPKGKEVFRVPGNWLVCVYPDGLAVPLKKE